MQIIRQWSEGMIGTCTKEEKLKELAALCRSLGESMQDDFVCRFIPELIEGHVKNQGSNKA